MKTKKTKPIVTDVSISNEERKVLNSLVNTILETCDGRTNCSYCPFNFENKIVNCLQIASFLDCVCCNYTDKEDKWH